MLWTLCVSTIYQCSVIDGIWPRVMSHQCFSVLDRINLMIFLFYLSNFTFFKLYLNTLKKPWSVSGINGRWTSTDLTKSSLDLASFTKNFITLIRIILEIDLVPHIIAHIFAAVSMDMVQCSRSSGLSTILSKFSVSLPRVLSLIPNTMLNISAPKWKVFHLYWL